MPDPTLLLKILGENKSAQKALEGTATAAGKMSRGIQSAALPAAAALGLIGAGALSTIDAASKVEQAYGALDSVFGDTADAAKAMSRSASQDVGLASSEYAQMSAVLGAQLKNMGTANDELATSTDTLIGLGADLAATFGGPTSDAVEAVSSLLRGERDPIERYGVSIKQADINARLAAQGLDKLEGEAKRQAEAQATLAILTEQTADAQGAFAREADTAAGAQQRASASFEDAKAALGMALLPVVAAAATAFSGLAGFVTENATAVQVLVGVVALLAGGILALNVVLKAWTLAQNAAKAATVIWTGVQWLLNAALTANPIGIVVVAIGALVAAIVLAYQNVEGFRAIVDAVFGAIVGIIGGAVDAIAGLIGGVVDFIRSHWRLLLVILAGPFGLAAVLIIDNLDKVQAVVQAVIGVIRQVFSTLTQTMTGPFKTLQTVAKQVTDAIAGFFRGLGKVIDDVFRGIKDAVAAIGRAIDSIPDLPSFSLPFSAPPPAPGVAGAYGRAGRGRAARAGTPAAGRGITVVVQSADPEEVMRALRRWAAANGGAPAFTRQLARSAS